jgi:hypothetical protein
LRYIVSVKSRLAGALVFACALAAALLATANAVGAPGASASTQRLVAGAPRPATAPRSQPAKRKDAKVEQGKRVQAGDLPVTGRKTAQWLALGVGSVGLGILLVLGSQPRAPLRRLTAPVWNGLVRAAACGYPHDGSIFELERN